MVERVLAIATLVAALAVTPSSSATPAAGGMFRVAEPGAAIDSVDGTLANLAGDQTFLAPTCASLTHFSDQPLPSGFRAVPDLSATFPKISKDGKTYVFTLRKGLRFNTGAPVTGADVAYTLNRLLRIHSPLTPAYTQIVGAQDVVDGHATRASGIVSSGRKVTFHLVQRVGDFVESAAASLCVLPAGTPLQPNGVTPPIPSAAPYYISEYVPGQRIVVKRNTFYRGPRPHHVDGFLFDLTVGDSEAIDDVANGKADYGWATQLTYASRASELAQRFGVNRKQFFVKPSPFLRMFALNTSRTLFRDNIPLRRAVNFAVDRPALVQQFGAYAETTVDHFLPPVMPGYRKTQIYPLRKPNLGKARILARGHTRSGRVVLYVPTRPTPQAQAQIVKRDLKRIGLDVQIVSFPPGAYFGRLANPKEPFDMAWVGWLANDTDPGSFLDSLFNGTTIGTPGNNNWSYFNSPRWNAALERASVLTGSARYRAFGRLDVALARDAAPGVAYGVDDALTLVSARTGCIVANPYLDLAAVCIK
jgi:peptide/nickel transport system substrate-binding protein